MKKQYQHPKMNLVEIDEWQCVVCTSPNVSATLQDFGSQSDGYGFNLGSNSGSGAPRRNGPWDE